MKTPLHEIQSEETFMPAVSRLSPVMQDPIPTALCDDYPENGSTRERLARFEVILSAHDLNAIAAALEIAFYSDDREKHGKIAEGRLSEASATIEAYRRQLPEAAKWCLSTGPLTEKLRAMGEVPKGPFLEGAPGNDAAKNIIPWPTK